MKTKLTLLLLTVVSLLHAQAPPDLINYQAIARDAAGNELSNVSLLVNVRISTDVNNTTIVYSETHTLSTNAFGLMNLKIGGGTPLSGTMNAIAWGTATHFINIRVDQSLSGSNYVDMGTSQLVSVPYAFHARTSDFAANGPTGVTGSAGPSGPTGPTGPIGNVGQQGLQGVTGANGATGATGVTGATGPTGAAGATGTNGTNGANGATGPTGVTGANGATGATGVTGSSGTNGTNGATGATGATGAAGSTGAQGVQGLQGPTGANGTNGATGAAGANGATGAQGPTGAAGATGATGATGVTGTFTTVGSTGQTLYHNGSGWVSSSNLYHNGTHVGVGPAGAGVITTPTATRTLTVSGTNNYTTDLASLELVGSGAAQTDILGRMDFVFVNPGPTYSLTSRIAGNKAGDLLFSTHDGTTVSEQFRLVGNTGNAGMGTTAPAYKLHAYRATGTSGIGIEMNGTNTASTGVLDFLTQGTTNATLGNPSTRGWNWMAYGESYPSTGGDLRLRYYNGVTPTEVMYFDAQNGRIGMGVAGPAYPLTISEYLGTTGVPVWAESGNSTSSLIAVNTSTSTAYSGFGYYRQGVNRARTAINTTNDWYLDLGSYSNLLFAKSSTGTVGIGTTTPSAKLTVNGNVAIPSANTFRYTAPKTKYLRIGSASLRSANAAYDAVIDDGFYNPSVTPMNGLNTLWASGGTAGNVAYFVAPVNFPDSAVITALSAQLVENGGSATLHAVVELYRSDGTSYLANNAQLIASCTTTNDGGGIAYVSAGTINGAYNVVSNQNYTYFIRFSGEQNTPNIRFSQAIITYQVYRSDW